MTAFENSADVDGFTVKRRFIRQNREIARVNSTQSLRIRNLEAEISRLLAENIALREQAIYSAQEAERWRSSQKLTKEVDILKDRFESKLLEVNALVTELGSLPEKVARRSSFRRKSGVVDTLKSPDQKDWKNKQTIGGVLAGERELQEGRLPAILEDKYYPRKTLETQELRDLIQDAAEASESPDIGPPPVAHFDVPDPINFEAGPVDTNQNINEPAEEEEVMVLTSNLETRRKRRASSFLEDMATLRLTSTDTEAQPAPIHSQDPSKSTTKRKPGARDEEQHREDGALSTDDFAFQRRPLTASTPIPRSRASRFIRPSNRQISESISEEPKSQNQRGDPPVRKVLGPKSTNPPTKVKKTTVNDKIAALKEEVANQAKARTERLDRKPKTTEISVVALNTGSAISQSISLNEDVLGTDLPPKTPAGLDLFSPTSTEPSVRSNAQPPEMAITTSVEDVLGNAGRGSRRARAAVSYAEPNLRDKMRRPGKELVTAVEGIERFKDRDMSARAESQDRGASEDAGQAFGTSSRGMPIKNEKSTNESGWKSLPLAKDEAPSPLTNKSNRLSNETKEMKESTETAEPGPPETRFENAISKLSIFDGPISSPHSDTKGGSPIETNDVAPKKSNLKSRRHSSNPASLSQLGQGLIPSAPDQLKARKKDFENASIERRQRPSSATGNRSDNSRPDSAAELKRSTSVAIGGSRPNSAADLKRSTSVTALADGASRMERMSSRRRSMMI